MFEDTVALVTGASRGAGEAIARALAGAGARVCVNYLRSADKAEAVAADIREAGGDAFAFQADVTDPDAVQSMIDAVVERYGRLDVVVNSALPDYKFDPAAPYVSAETVEWSHFTHQLEGVVRGALNTVQAALPLMKEQGGGKVINISSNLVYNPVVTYHDYTTAKAGLVGLTRTLAAELGQYGIRVNLVAGGLLDKTDASAATTDEVFDLIAANSPLKKAVTPDEFAQAVPFFASPWSDAVTGQSLSVDAGLTMP